MKRIFHYSTFFLLLPVIVNAGDTSNIQLSLDTLWVLLAAFMVFFMQAGFGMVEAGLTRTKNAVNILMKNTMDVGMASLGFFVFGYAIMFGNGNSFMGFDGWLLLGVESDGGLPVYAFWLFQAVFVGTAATIVSGGVAERMKFKAYLLYSLLISALVYPIVGHWTWGGGWLADLGFYDFAGSTVVHATGGFAALVGAMMLGPRIGKFNKDGSPNSISGHSMPLLMIGVIILWFGWFGFNAGSSLEFTDPELIARISINTLLAAAAGINASMFYGWFKFGKPDLALTLNGALAGLVGITAGCSVVSPLSAIVIGSIAGVFVILAVQLLDKLKIDDPVGAFPVHGFNGVWGTIAVGIFGQKSLGLATDGILFGGGFGQLGIQVLGTLATALFVVIAMYVVFKIIDKTVGLRVSREEELKGLDDSEHSMESYSGFQIFTTD